MNVQVRLMPGGQWHRRCQGTATTACGLDIPGAYASRDHELDLDLCAVCFTPHERDTGEVKKAELEAAAFEMDEDTDRIEIPPEWSES